MDKITIERETVELAASLIQPLTGKGDREVYDALRAALAAQPAEPVAWRWKERVNGMSDSDWTVTNVEPPDGVRVIAKESLYAAQPADIANPISQQEPVAYRHSKTGQLYDSEEEVPLADGDEWAEPLYAAPVAQQEPSAWRQWSTKQHDWDYQTNRGDLRPDALAEPLFVAAAQPGAIEQALQKIADFGQEQEQKPVAWIGLPGKGTPLFTAPPAPAAVPPGYVLVPIEPTQAILDAPFVGKVQPQDWHSHKRSRELMAENYRAMIAAAGDKP